MEICSGDMVRPPVTVRLDPRLLERVERFMAKQKVRVSRTAVFEAALTKFLDEQEPADQKPKRKGK